MPKDNYTVAKICYFITSMFAGFSAYANFMSGRTALAVVWALLCALFLFAASKMKKAGQRAKEIGMIDNSKSARAARKKEEAEKRAAEVEAAKTKIVEPGVSGSGDVAAAVSASLYSGKKGEEAQEAVAEEPAEAAEAAEEPAEKE